MAVITGFFNGLEIQTELSQTELLGKISLLSQLCEYSNALLSTNLNDCGPPNEAVIAATCHMVAVCNELIGELIFTITQITD